MTGTLQTDGSASWLRMAKPTLFPFSNAQSSPSHTASELVTVYTAGDVIQKLALHTNHGVVVGDVNTGTHLFVSQDGRGTLVTNVQTGSGVGQATYAGYFGLHKFGLHKGTYVTLAEDVSHGLYPSGLVYPTLDTTVVWKARHAGSGFQGQWAALDAVISALSDAGDEEIPPAVLDSARGFMTRLAAQDVRVPTVYSHGGDVIFVWESGAHTIFVTISAGEILLLHKADGKIICNQVFAVPIAELPDTLWATLPTL